MFANISRHAKISRRVSSFGLCVIAAARAEYVAVFRETPAAMRSLINLFFFMLLEILVMFSSSSGNKFVNSSFGSSFIELNGTSSKLVTFSRFVFSKPKISPNLLLRSFESKSVLLIFFVAIIHFRISYFSSAKSDASCFTTVIVSFFTPSKS